MKRVALFVGVANYKKENGFRSLDCTEADALAMHQLLTKHGYVAPAPLIDPTTDELEDAIYKATADLGPGDHFFFYFSGHGVTQNGHPRLICINDKSVKISRSTIGYALGDVEDIVRTHEGCHCTIVTDACRSDVFVGSKGTCAATSKDITAHANIVKTSKAKKSKGSLTLVTSCDVGDASSELPSKGRGAFSLAFENTVNAYADKGFAVNLRNAHFFDDVDSEMNDLLKTARAPEQSCRHETNGRVPDLIDGNQPPNARITDDGEKQNRTGLHTVLIAALALIACGAALFAWKSPRANSDELVIGGNITDRGLKKSLYVLHSKASQASERNKEAKYAEISHFRKTSLELEAFFRSGREAAKAGDYIEATNFFTRVGVNARWLIKQTALRKESLSAQQSARDALASAVSANAAKHAAESFCKGTNQLALATAFLDRGEFGEAASAFGECSSLLVTAKDVADKATRTEQERQHAIALAAAWRSNAERACSESEESRYSEVRAFAVKIAECRENLEKGKTALADENFGTATNHFAACIAAHNWLISQNTLRATALEWRQTVRKSRESIENAKLQSYADKAYSAAVAGIEKADGLLETGDFAGAQRVYGTANKVFGRVVEAAEKAKREEEQKAAEKAREAEIARLCAEDGYTRTIVDGKPFAKWVAGKIHPRCDALVTDSREKSWVSRKAGYVWDGGEGVHWMQGLRYQEYPHWTSGPQEGTWEKDRGYTAEGHDAPFPARLSWVPGVEFGDTRTGYAEGTWQRKVSCSNCRGKGNVQLQSSCSQCDGMGRVTVNERCASCSGQGTVTVANTCGTCRGSGQTRSSCTATGAIKRGNRIICQHGSICPSCQGQGMVQDTAASVANAVGGILTAISSKGRQRPRRQQAQMVRCSTCSGRGWVSCSACGGSRVVSAYCPSCSGTGKINNQSRCSSCRGAGSHSKTVNCTSCSRGKVYTSEPCPTCSGSGLEWK